MKYFISIILILGAICAMGQLGAPDRKPIVGPRKPAISPDGKILAFVYRGDIWTVSSSGGRAVRLTDNVEYDTLPIFSPDGQWIAFTSTRTGNTDVFVVPASGGTPRQLTFTSYTETATDWSPDGRYILFVGKRDVPESSLFETNVKTLQYRRVTMDYKILHAPAYSPDGKLVVYIRDGFPWQRPRYRGSAAAKIWIINRETGKRQEITHEDSQHYWPKFLSDNKTIVCVATGEPTPSTTKIGAPPIKWTDNAQKTANLWAFDLNGKGYRLTDFVGDSVRFPTVARKSDDIAFEYGDGIWLLKKGAKEPVKVTIYASADSKETEIRRETITRGTDDIKVSLDGKMIAFGAKSEIWSLPIEKSKKRNPDDAVRLTDYVGWDAWFNWSKDGKKLYFVSDREVPISLFELDTETLKAKKLYQGINDVLRPELTPDNKQLAFWVTDDGLYTLDLDTNKASKVLDLPGTGTWGPGGYEFVYSPDMQWIAYTKKSPRGAVDIWIMPAKGGKSINVTKLNASHSDMQWSPDGKYLFFLSNRNGNGLYALPLKREEVPAEDVQMKFDAPKDKAAVKFDIDFQDSETRIRKLVTLDPIGNLKLSPDGNFYYLSNKELWSASYDGKELKRRTNIGGVSNFEITADGKKIVLIKAGTIQILDPSNDTVTPFNFIANFERDTRLEQKAAFKQYWRTFNRLFYDQNFHGRDWKAIHDRYEPLLDGVAVRQEFDELLVMMVGELEASHTEVWSNGGPQPPTTPFLGFYFDYSYQGPGIRIKEVPERAPGSYAKTQLKPGEYVMAVNGKDIRLDEYLFKMLNDFAGKDIELTVNSVPTKSGARKVTYKAINPFEWRELDYRNQIQRMREEVDRLSGGRIAYVQIPGMGGENQEQFEREFYEYADGKEAAIIDVRGNGGGNVGDTLATWLAVKPFAFTTARRSDIRETPDHSWGKPTVVLSNENVFSNGETFAYCAKKLGFGTVIGMPTPGYVIWTDEFDMVNGAVGRIPGAGYYRIDGTTLENDGEKPDITVDMTLEDWEAKRDPQLEAGIEYLMKKIAK